MAVSHRRDGRGTPGTAGSRQSASYHQFHASRAFGSTRTNRARARPLRTLGDLYGPRKRQEAERDETTTLIAEGSTCNRNLASLRPIRMLRQVRRVPHANPARVSCSTRSLASGSASILPTKRPSKAILFMRSPAEDSAERRID